MKGFHFFQIIQGCHRHDSFHLKGRHLPPKLHSIKFQVLITKDEQSAFPTGFFEALFESLTKLQPNVWLVTGIIFSFCRKQRHEMKLCSVKYQALFDTVIKPCFLKRSTVCSGVPILHHLPKKYRTIIKASCELIEHAFLNQDSTSLLAFNALWTFRRLQKSPSYGCLRAAIAFDDIIDSNWRMDLSGKKFYLKEQQRVKLYQIRFYVNHDYSTVKKASPQRSSICLGRIVFKILFSWKINYFLPEPDHLYKIKFRHKNFKSWSLHSEKIMISWIEQVGSTSCRSGTDWSDKIESSQKWS